jgi:hypothetical protein
LAAWKAVLKSMSVADLKELALKKGVEKGTKDEMVEALLKMDAAEQ